MFALNEGSKWGSSKYAESLHGVVYMPMSNHIVRMRRRPLGDVAWQLFDPQLYLTGLDCEQATKVCSRLATYPWFGVEEIPEFDSDAGGQRDWEHDVQDVVCDEWHGELPDEVTEIRGASLAAIEFQAEISCSHIILPTPLISEREDEAETQAIWVDEGLAAAEDADVGQPVIATVAISEAVLNTAAFEQGGFLDTVVDQITSREGLSGVYIVIAQTEANHPLSPPYEVTAAYAHLTRAFVEYGHDFVFVNFADTFGIACLGLGATAFATGPTQNLRRLSLAGFRDTGGGPFPRYYSHRAVGEFLPDSDLRHVAAKRLLRRVEDRTRYSRDLLQALAQTGRANTVANWIESRNNVFKAAQPHFITRMILEGEAYGSRDLGQRSARAESWLDDAVVNQAFLADRLEDTGAQPNYAPASDWLAQFRDLV
ncbi:MAG: hypothetical protein R3B57_14780 [Phycisphaerales bacterium]